MERKIFVKRFREAIENGNAAIFAGAGLSRPSGYMDWKSLLKKAAEELGVEITPCTDLVDLAQYYVNQFGNNVELANAVLNAFKGGKPNINHAILASLPIHCYWTTNYDTLIEDALTDAGKLCDVKSRPTSLTTSSNKRDAIVYKMHGDVECPEDTILTRNQFEDYPHTHEAFLNSFTYDLTNKTFLFLGLSFDDPNIKYVFNRVRLLFHENQRTHYYLTRKETKDKQSTINQGLFVEDLKRYNIQTIFINDYDELTDVLSEIQTSYKRRTIFISGAAHDYAPHGEDTYKDFITKLSAGIIQRGFRIVTGYGLGIGNEIINGAVTELNKMHKPIDGNLIVHPFPQGDASVQALWQNYREEMISECGVVIFLLGNKIDKTTGELVPSNGMANEYEIAKSHNCFLIPVGATGYITETLWKEQRATITTDAMYNDYVKEFNSIGDKSLPLPKLLDIIIDFITKISS